MFGISALSQAPFSSTAGGAIYEASSVLSAVSVFNAVVAKTTSIAPAIAPASAFSSEAVRYTFGRAEIVSESDFTSAFSITYNPRVTVQSNSSINATCAYTTNALFAINSQTSIISAVRLKWESEPIVSETWTVIPSQNETWTPLH